MSSAAKTDLSGDCDAEAAVEPSEALVSPCLPERIDRVLALPISSRLRPRFDDLGRYADQT